jgi:NADH-quinone oxidoreductase subunit J
MVLFLFVVMMLDIDIETLRSGFTRHPVIGVVTALVLLGEIVGVVVAKGLAPGMDMQAGMVAAAADASNSTELGTAIYTRYLYPFELAAVLLLVAIIAAIVLTMRRRQGLKVQDITAQVKVRARDRVRIVKMPAEKSGSEASQ